MLRKNSSRRSAQRLLYLAEQLECRRLLTSTLYVDFGDNFPVAGLAGTVGTLKTATSGVAGDPAVAGPDMDEDTNGDFASADIEDADAFNMFSFNSRYTADGGNYTGGVAQLRADIMTFVQRFYQPYDIDVIELTSATVNVNGRLVSGADSLADISSNMGANEAGVAKNNDGYVLVGQTIVHRPAAQGGDIDISTLWGGYASVIDMPSGNNSDNTAIGFVAPGALGPGVGPGGWGNLIAHEAGHLFGFQHSLTQAPSGAVSPLIPTSEIMSYLGNSGFNFFSRYPQVRGNANTSNNEDLMATTPPAPAANRTPYDQWINIASIGQNTAFHYVTGTGANDIITIAKSGGNATISVQAFSDTSFSTALNVPGSGGASTTYSYTLALDRPFVLDGGDRNDRFVIDGDLGITLTVRGMNGTDELVVMGKNAASATYTTGTNSANGLDNNPDLRGSAVIGTTTINFQEFENAGSVTIRDVDTLTYVTGGSDDDITLDSPAAAQMRLDGTSDSVNLVGVTFFNVGALNVDTGANDGGTPGDDVLLAASSVAAGLNTISVNTGGGTDELDVNFGPGNPIPAGGLSYNGGTGSNDLLTLRGGSFTNETSNALGPGAGNINLDGTMINYTNLAPVNDTVPVVNYAFDGTVGIDAINVVNGPFTDGAQTLQINGPTFELQNIGRKTNVDINGQTGIDVFNLTATVASTGLATLSLNGQNPLNALDDSSVDVFTLSTTLPGVPLTVRGGGGGDLFTIVGAGAAAGSNPTLLGQDGADFFSATLSSDTSITVDGGAFLGSDTLLVDGEGFEHGVLATQFGRPGAFPLNFVNVELLRLFNGQYNVAAPAILVPNVQVEQDAKLFGTGTVVGSVSALVNGVISPGLGLGFATGILSTGSVSFAATSSYQVQVNGLVDGTEHDVLNVIGTVSLGNANLDLAAGVTVVPGDEIVIVRNDGVDPVVGKFAQGDLIQVGTQKFAIDYTYAGDADGVHNDVALIRYGAALAPDPCEPGKLALFVSATTGDDDIRFVGKGNKTIEVFINNVSEGVFQPSGLLIGFGQDGNDTINVQVPSRESWLFGQDDNDTLNIGNNDGILLGGNGNDNLAAGNGKDIAVGGQGADIVRGQNGPDLMIGGSLTFETNNAANRAKLCDIFDEWVHGTGGLKGKVNHLTNGGGKNGTTVLDATTVLDDNAVDSLLGTHGKGWYIGHFTGGGAIDITDATKNDPTLNI